VAGVVLGFVFTTYRFDSVTSDLRRNAVTQCERGINRNTAKLRDLLLRARVTSATSPTQSAERRIESERFYVAALNDLTFVRCPGGTQVLPPPSIPPLPVTVP